MSTESTDGGVLENNACVNISEVVGRLNVALGPTLVAALAGSRDRTISINWQRLEGHEPNSTSLLRLRFAYRIWVDISAVEGGNIARFWFIGANPWLGGDSPVDAIREDRFKAVESAAQAMLEDRFAG